MKAKFFLIIFVFLLNFSNANDLKHWLKSSTSVVPSDNPQNIQKIKLGKLLFFDKRLSSTDTISCASCHNPALGWSDGLKVAVGVEKRVGRRNTPTILNSVYLSSFFHDGRASSLEEQAKGSIESSVEMDMPIEKLVKKLQKIEGYEKFFIKAFKTKGITKEKILKAIASFERTIVASDTPFIRWVKGDKYAIGSTAKKGFEIFNNKGKCSSCHNGFNFTDESFNNIGLGDKKDLGVYEVTKGKSRVWYGAFKTPTLIGVELTAPYFHDGSIKTLKEAVTICGNGGRKPVKIRSPFFRDRNLNKEDVVGVVAFLKTLTPLPFKIIIPKVFPK